MTPSPDAPGQGEAGVGGEVERLTPDEWDDICEALQTYVHSGEPRQQETYMLPTVERILTAHVAAARADAEGRLGEVRGRLRAIAELEDQRDDRHSAWTARRLFEVLGVLDAAGPREGDS